MKEPFDSDLPPIPKFRNLELRDAVSALVHSGAIYRQAFLDSMEGNSPHEFLTKHMNLLISADKVITKWLDEFSDIDFDLPDSDIDPEQN